MDVEAVSPDHLPGEVAASAEATDIAFEHKPHKVIGVVAAGLGSRPNASPNRPLW